MAVDHIYPASRIVKRHGFDTLTREQMTDLLQDRIGLGNLQPLPQSRVQGWAKGKTRPQRRHSTPATPLHPFGGAQNPFYPLGRGPGSLREMFQRVDSIQYWKWRGSQELRK